VQSAAAAPEKKKPASINALLARRDTDDVDDDESRGNFSDLSEEELDDPRNEQVRGGARASSRHEHRARCLRPDPPARHRRRDERAVRCFFIRPVCALLLRLMSVRSSWSCDGSSKRRSRRGSSARAAMVAASKTRAAIFTRRSFRCANAHTWE
jgi:hypothetical protein